MTTNNPETTKDLASLEAQVSQLTDPATVKALDAALRAQAAPALLADEAALLADLRLAALLDGALAAQEAPAGLADRVLAAAPLIEAHEVAGKVGPAVRGRVGGGWMHKPWRYAAVASVSFSLSLMAVSFIVKKEATLISGAVARSGASSEIARIQLVVMDSGVSDDGLDQELEQTKAELELAGL